MECDKDRETPLAIVAYDVLTLNLQKPKSLKLIFFRISHNTTVHISRKQDPRTMCEMSVWFRPLHISSEQLSLRISQLRDLIVALGLSRYRGHMGRVSSQQIIWLMISKKYTHGSLLHRLIVVDSRPVKTLSFSVTWSKPIWGIIYKI